MVGNAWKSFIPASWVISGFKNKKGFSMLSSRPSFSVLITDLFHPSHLTISKTNFNSVRMFWGICKNVFHFAFCKSSTSLVLF